MADRAWIERWEVGRRGRLVPFCALTAVVALLASAAGAQPSQQTPADRAATAPSSPARPLAGCPLTGAEEPGDRLDADGAVFRRYAAYGYRHQPLTSFGRLNGLVRLKARSCADRLASALVRRAVRRGDAWYWEFDFSAGGGTPWTSGFVQAVAAQALARASALLDDPELAVAARRAFRALRPTLVLPLAGGLWIREYSFTDQAILNAQLQSILSIESYARVTRLDEAARFAEALRTATRRLLPRFGTGCWSRYELGGGAATTHYHRYHVELLRSIAAAHRRERIWRDTYVRWSRCA